MEAAITFRPGRYFIPALARRCSTSLVELAVAELLNPRKPKRKGSSLTLYVKIDL